jgi:Caspase domain
MKASFFILIFLNTWCATAQRQLAWLNPKDATTLTTSAGQLDISLTLKDVINVDPKFFKVFLNGQSVENNVVGATKFDNVSLNQNAFVYRNQVVLMEGEQDIVVVYRDAVGEIRAPTLRVKRQMSRLLGDFSPNLYVLTLGPSTNLQFTVKDACDFANAFRGQAVGNKPLFKSTHIQSLLGKDATGAAMSKVIEGMERSYQAQKTLYPNTPELSSSDLLVIYLSSHGFRDGTDYYVMGSDADPSAPRGSSVRFDFILSMLEKLPCRKLLFIDACQNGIDAMPNTSLPILTIKQDNLAVFTSASAGETSIEDLSAQQGAFTKILFDGLHGAADKDQNGIISLLELNAFLPPSVQKYVHDMTRGFMRQTPQLLYNSLGEIDLFQSANFQTRYFMPCQFEMGNLTQVIGLRLTTPEGIDDDLTEKISKVLKNKGLRADFFDGVATKSFSTIMVGQFNYQKIETQTIGTAQVHIYRVQLLFQMVDGKTGKKCTECMVETTTPIYASEPATIIKQNCVSALLAKLKNTDLPTCW